MTKLEAFLLLRANPRFEGISDSILRGYVACLPEQDDALLADNQIAELKRHLQEYMQYYAVCGAVSP